jgi:hypothetical protein
MSAFFIGVPLVREQETATLKAKPLNFACGADDALIAFQRR